MKKRSKALNLFVKLYLISAFIFLTMFNSNVFLTKAGTQVDYESTVSPSLQCTATRFLQVDERITDMQLVVDKRDNKISFEAYDMPQLQEDEIYFAVFIDSRRGVFGSKYMTLHHGAQYDTQRCSYIMPYHCDVVDIHIYKQKITEPAFTIKEENFIGRAKFFPAHDSLFYRSQSYVDIVTYDENNNPVQDLEFPSASFSRLTPNFYSLYLPLYGYTDHAEIILPEGKEDLMPKEEKFVVPTQYRIDAATEENTTLTLEYYLDFYLPDGIDEFKVKYTTVDYEHVKKIYYFYIKLKKQ